jgi:glycosyltransferase involved in cell wall biosynthesis
MTIQIYMLRTERPHWGEYSGSDKFVPYVDKSRYYIKIYNASDSDDDFNIRSKRIRRFVRYIIRRNGMQFYKLSDLVAEYRAMRICHKESFDILHYMDGEHSAQFLPSLKKRLHLRSKLVASFHQPTELLTSLTDKRVISKLDHVILISPCQSQYFKNLLPEKCVSVIPLGINTDFFRPLDKKRNNPKLRCILVGHWLRDFTIARKVAERLASNDDIEFAVVISERTGPPVIGLENLSNVRLIRKHLTDLDLLHAYNACDVLFLPLLNSTSNNSLLEAIACGLPVLTSDLPSVRFYLPGDEAILIKNNNVDEFVNSLLHLAENQEKRMHMGSAARKRALQLDWRNIAPLYQKLYEDLVAR